MIRGIGIDLAEIGRIRDSWERFGERFAKKILTEPELQTMRGRKDPVPYLAALWAAKEAGAKALGTGFAQGVHQKCFEVTHLPTGKPEMALKGAALELAGAMGVSSVYVSMTHEHGAAAAVVVFEGD